MEDIEDLHKHALLVGNSTYIDPLTGYKVFTSDYLKHRPCCGNKCRHCPYEHKNVSKKHSNKI